MPEAMHCSQNVKWAINSIPSVSMIGQLEGALPSLTIVKQTDALVVIQQAKLISLRRQINSARRIAGIYGIESLTQPKASMVRKDWKSDSASSWLSTQAVWPGTRMH